MHLAALFKRAGGEVYKSVSFVADLFAGDNEDVKQNGQPNSGLDRRAWLQVS